jgi:hydroxylamine reductase
MPFNCDQCEQTHQGLACTSDVGICGKDADMESLQKILLYGLKGMAAYKAHARRLGKDDIEVNAFIEDALFATMTNVNFDMGSLLDLVLKCGMMNLKVMQLLNDGHIELFGKPGPAEVRQGSQAGPGILVTGHDMLDLWNVLKACEGTDIKVYTHGEMLPAFMYPKLREHPNLAGHYGGAWQKQRDEFETFTGPIVGTTNCVLIPKSNNTYLGRFFTTRVTAVPGARIINDEDFSCVVECAKQCAPLADNPQGTSTVGFHYTALLDAAPQILAAIQAGQLRHFFVIGGCDGAEPGRNYYSRYAQATPEDSLILTLGCGKYRIRDFDYGTVAGFPRLLDMGQCNDAYGAIQVAVTLAQALGCGVNDLPLTLVISWFEQKAVAVLLTLLALDVKGVRIGPKPPAFISPGVLKILQERWDLRLIDPKADPVADCEAALARA